MAYRKIEVDGKEYRWTSGSDKVIIQNSEGQRIATADVDKVGVYIEDYNYSVTPKHVAQYIRKITK